MPQFYLTAEPSLQSKAHRKSGEITLIQPSWYMSNLTTIVLVRVFRIEKNHIIRIQ